MKAVIKSTHSASFEKAFNNEVFSFDFSLEIGFDDQQGQEIFNFFVVSPPFLKEKYFIGENRYAIFGKDLIITRVNNLKLVEKFSEKYINSFHNITNWEDLAAEIGKYGQWEFEDYIDFSKSSSIKTEKAILKSVYIQEDISFFDYIPKSDLYCFDIFVEIISVNDPIKRKIFIFNAVSYQYLLQWKNPLFGKNMIIIFQYNPKIIYLLIENYINNLEEKTWQDICYKMERIALKN